MSICAREKPATTKRYPPRLPTSGRPQWRAGASHSTLPTQRMLHKRTYREAGTRHDAHRAHATGASYHALTLIFEEPCGGRRTQGRGERKKVQATAKDRSMADARRKEGSTKLRSRPFCRPDCRWTVMSATNARGVSAERATPSGAEPTSRIAPPSKCVPETDGDHPNVPPSLAMGSGSSADGCCGHRINTTSEVSPPTAAPGVTRTTPGRRPRLRQ